MVVVVAVVVVVVVVVGGAVAGAALPAGSSPAGFSPKGAARELARCNNHALIAASTAAASAPVTTRQIVAFDGGSAGRR